MLFGGGGAIGERTRARMNAAVAAMTFEANRRDLEEAGRGRHLEQIGATGHVAFGFYVEGLGPSQVGSLCNAAVIPSSVVFLDADASAEPGAELGRAPRTGLTFEVEEWRGTVVNAEFDAPWQMKSLDAPGALEVVARVAVDWPAGFASFAFASIEGAKESLDYLQRHLSRTPEV